MNAKIDGLPLMLTVKEAAEFLRIPQRNLYENLIPWGIPHTRLSERRIRIPREDLKIWLEKRQATSSVTNQASCPAHQD